MKVKCDYCGAYIDDTNETCPNCCAPVEGHRFANQSPETIEQLREWYKSHNLPPEEVTRFFIGKDIKSPKAFGIYKDAGGDFIVYKNKSDGSRSVRYKGSDEAYAVQQLYSRLKEEIANQKALNAGRHIDSTHQSHYSVPTKASGITMATVRVFIIAMVLQFAALALCLIIGFIRNPFMFDTNYKYGYYKYDNTVYYEQSSDDWYVYRDDWTPIAKSALPSKFHTYDSMKEYYLESQPDNVSSFYDSAYYIIPETYRYVKDGYYKQNDTIYYNQYDHWYRYDEDKQDWVKDLDVPASLVQDYRGTYSYDWQYGDTAVDYVNTDYYDWECEQYRQEFQNIPSGDSYDSGSSYDSDWDSGSTWDSSDTWDSGSTDWDSDW